MEVIIADGRSTDGTRQAIAEYQKHWAELSVTVVDNPERIIPAALNHALAAARGEYILRLDAHAVPRPDYVERCLTVLQAGKAENVGGVWEILPGGKGWLARSIAAAAAHPLGAGDALYRHSRQAQYVDTVPFGAFRRDLIEKIGLFNTALHSNEDYEFNVRLKGTGGRIWLDPQIRSQYFARATLGALVRQYLRYGYWKGRMLKTNMGSLRWRQALPPLFVFAQFLLAAGAFFTEWSRFLLAGLLSGYVLILLAAGVQAALRRRDPPLLIGFPLAIAAMHYTWGTALLYGLLRPG